MSEDRQWVDATSRRLRRRRDQLPPAPRPPQIMLHEALAILWSLYVIYRFLEMTVDEPMNNLEYYTQ